MARIIESIKNSRRIIKLSTDDIITVVQEYQQYIPRMSDYKDTRNILENIAIFLPEDV